MPWPTRLTALLAIAVAALACSDQPAMQLTDPQAEIEGGPACKLSDLRGAARAFFGIKSPGYDLAQQFTVQNANTPAVLPIFFDLAHHIAVKAGPTGLSEAEAALGAEVHRQAVACAPVVDPDYDDDMDNVKAALGPDGAYQVRGRTGTDNATVLSHNTGDNGSSGLKPPPAGFSAWTGGPVIFYGFTEAEATLEGEAPADPDFPATFHWFTVRPAGAEYSATLRGLVGICVSTSTPALNTDQFRIQHEAGNDAVVLPVSDFNVCTTTSATHHPPLSPIRRVLAWLQERVAPTPLQAAAAVVATTSPSGSVKKFSPVEAVNPGGATMEFVPSLIPNTVVDEGLGVQVRATGANGVPWEGLNIKLIPFDNNGNYQLSPDEAVTDDQGIADFSASILDKPGGYLLLAITQPGADDDATGFAPDSVVSENRFLRTPN